MKRLALLLVLLPATALAQDARPRSIADCEKIKADLAYNNCLASFGPKVGERAARVAAPGDEDGPAVRRSRRGSRAVRTRGGRQRAAFEIRSGRVQAAPVRTNRAKRSKRRR
ncbi:MAG TPA: hypothetical protein VM434_08190 [Beijerinckiaceae bacterium]|nr:hypothetical protein [Beijerinckiaceae bacterium]